MTNDRELTRRARSMEQALACGRLEGLELDPEAAAAVERFVASDRTGEQLVEEMSRLPLP